MRAVAAALTLACASLILSGCATSGAAAAAFAADPEIRALAPRALAGDEQAQLALGIRYEEGRGVPVDLGRARELYFDAATRPSGNRVSTYVATPGGAVSSFIHTVPAGLEYSGNEEALLRWHRLLPNPRRDAAGSPPPRLAVAAADQGPRATSYAPTPEEAQAGALVDLIGLHGYQPIFNGLKSREGPWQGRIVAETGARFFAPDMVANSFLFMIDAPPQGEAGRTIDQARIQAFCAANMPSAGAIDSAHRRLAGLCALADCGTVSQGQWSALAGSVESGLAGGRDDPNPGDAEDAAFLLRVASVCGARAVAARLVRGLTAYERRITALREQCPREACGEPDNLRVRRSLGVDAHLLLAVAEGNAVPAELAAAAAGHWLDSRSVVRPDENSVDRAIEARCARAAIAAPECRQRFPYSYFLEQHYLDDRARALATAAPGADPCVTIRAFGQRFAQEIQYRFHPTLFGGRLHFAPRCNASGVM